MICTVLVKGSAAATTTTAPGDGVTLISEGTWGVAVGAAVVAAGAALAAGALLEGTATVRAGGAADAGALPNPNVAAAGAELAGAALGADTAANDRAAPVVQHCVYNHESGLGSKAKGCTVSTESVGSLASVLQPSGFCVLLCNSGHRARNIDRQTGARLWADSKAKGCRVCKQCVCSLTCNPQPSKPCAPLCSLSYAQPVSMDKWRDDGPPVAAGAALADGAMAGVEAAGKENAGVEAAPSVAPPRLKPPAAAEAPAAEALMENPPVPAPKPASPHCDCHKGDLHQIVCTAASQVSQVDASSVDALCWSDSDCSQVWLLSLCNTG